MKITKMLITSNDHFLAVVAIGLLGVGLSVQESTSTPPTPVDFYKPALEFLRHGFDIFEKTLYSTNLTHRITKNAVFKDDKTSPKNCLNLPQVASFIRDCVKFPYNQNETKIRTYYNETQFRDLLHADQCAYASMNYVNTMGLTSLYARVYAESIFFVHDISVNVIEKAKIDKEILDEDFVADVEKLSENGDDFTANDFITLYGSHYFSNATFGGSLRIVDLIEVEEYEDTGEEQAHAYLAASIYQFFGFNGHIHVPYDWKDAKTTKVYVRGGNEHMDEIEYPDEALEWYNSVGSHDGRLAITNGSIVPLVELFHFVITDEKTLRVTVQQMQDAIAIQNAKFYLQSLIDGLGLVALDPVVSKLLHGCFDPVLLGEYFQSVLEESDPRETMKSDIFKERTENALSDTNFVVVMRDFLPPSRHHRNNSNLKSLPEEIHSL